MSHQQRQNQQGQQHRQNQQGSASRAEDNMEIEDYGFESPDVMDIDDHNPSSLVYGHQGRGQAFDDMGFNRHGQKKPEKKERLVDQDFFNKFDDDFDETTYA